MRLGNIGILLLNLFLIAAFTGFAWVLFQIIFVTFFTLMILGAAWSNAFSRL